MIVYLTGAILAYILVKRAHMKFVVSYWTLLDRYLCLFMSMFSWISVLAALIVLTVIYCADSNVMNKPAKW